MLTGLYTVASDYTDVRKVGGTWMLPPFIVAPDVKSPRELAMDCAAVGGAHGDCFHVLGHEGPHSNGVRTWNDRKKPRNTAPPDVRTFEAAYQAKRAELAPVVRGPQLGIAAVLEGERRDAAELLAKHSPPPPPPIAAANLDYPDQALAELATAPAIELTAGALVTFVGSRNAETRAAGHRVVVSMRLRPKLLARLDKLCDAWRAKEKRERACVAKPLTRTELIEVAVYEWLDRNESED